jgi:ribosomal protein S18 acetylase RimI-like enzyme
MVGFSCTRDTFKPVAHGTVRWLDQDKDFPLFQAIRVSLEPPTRAEWDEWHTEGYQYCAIVENGEIVSVAAALRRSESAWEVAAVWTHPDFRGRGYAKAVCSFVTAYILDTGRVATCGTRENNAPMIGVVKALGFERTVEDA